MEGVYIWDLSPGTQITVRTKHTVYILNILEKKGNVMIRGGKYFPEFKEIYFNGSSRKLEMRCGYIGHDMQMELIDENKVIITSPVMEIKINGTNI